MSDSMKHKRSDGLDDWVILSLMGGVVLYSLCAFAYSFMVFAGWI